MPADGVRVKSDLQARWEFECNMDRKNNEQLVHDARDFIAVKVLREEMFPWCAVTEK
ncbi:predicted protein [Plenodomus lingam JN3]|uniref:Predicted protein n=1 Tax=Leptosphaeria maculans (strain JN3 / isolate v23.1.3 / race Av1-4-5-6-7-8) TaxID=985895 RepID=E5ADU5_LEPMJ|nr:predicted protein [Plenodomus lingam JN3]CBY01384.1 predicted protein [Plenodomus lingam JN3]